MVQGMLHFIEKSPTCFHAVQTAAGLLEEKGFVRLEEGGWELKAGGSYYTVRNGASLIGFRLPKTGPTGFMLTAAHSDSPCFRIRDNCMSGGSYARLSAERYGGMLHAAWTDRPLSIAGRVMVRREGEIACRLVDFQQPMALIPNVAIHLNREANTALKYDAATDLMPLYGGAGADFRQALAAKLECAAEDILATDLFLYNPQKGEVWGPAGEFVSAPRLDDLAGVYACVQALLMTDEPSAVAMVGIFDHEEIGSETGRGAASDFLADTVDAICEALGMGAGERRKLLSQSMMLSCDNAHGRHPNRPELSDAAEAPVLGGGVVLKHAARYTTDSVSGAVFFELCRRAGVPMQHYSNRPDQAGGSTLGNIANTKIGICAADIGIPQLAMHSSYETAGSRDVSCLVRVLQAFYGAKLKIEDHRVRLD